MSLTPTDRIASSQATPSGERAMKHGAPELVFVAQAVFRASFADDEDEAVVRQKWNELEDDCAKAIRTARFVIQALGGWGRVSDALSHPPSPSTPDDRQGLVEALASCERALTRRTEERNNFATRLTQAVADLRTVGDDYPGSSCQKWCHERADAALGTPEPATQAAERGMVEALESEIDRQEGLAKTYRQAQLNAEALLERERANAKGWEARCAVLEKQIAALAQTEAPAPDAPEILVSQEWLDAKNETDPEMEIDATTGAEARADGEVERLRQENARLRQFIADTANSFNIVGSPYDKAVQALDEMVASLKAGARAALQPSTPAQEKE